MTPCPPSALSICLLSSPSFSSSQLARSKDDVAQEMVLKVSSEAAFEHRVLCMQLRDSSYV